MSGRKQPQKRPPGLVKPPPPPAPPRKRSPVIGTKPGDLAQCVVYDGLTSRQRTWILIDRDHPVGLGLVKRTAESKQRIADAELPGLTHPQQRQPWLMPGDVIKVGDLEDGSDRSRIIKGHLERGVCRLVE